MGVKSDHSYGSTGSENSLETGVSATPRAEQKGVSRTSLVAAFLFAVGLMMLAVASNGRVTGQKLPSETSFNKVESAGDKVSHNAAERSMPRKRLSFDLSPTHTNNGKKRAAR